MTISQIYRTKVALILVNTSGAAVSKCNIVAPEPLEERLKYAKEQRNIWLIYYRTLAIINVTLPIQRSKPASTRLIRQWPGSESQVVPVSGECPR